jgi:hypothetical protein
MEDLMEEKNGSRYIAIFFAIVLGLCGVTYSLVIDRMNKQEVIATADITALREEIKTTKADAKDAVAQQSSSQKDAVAATASALRESVAATALAAKESVAASASALKDSVSATALSSRDATNAIASALSDKISILSLRLDRLENRYYK